MMGSIPAELEKWQQKLNHAVTQRLGGQAATLLGDCPLAPKPAEEHVPRNDLLRLFRGAELGEVALFTADAAQTQRPSRRLRLLLCAFDAFTEYHTRPRTKSHGWDTALLVTMLIRIRAAASVHGAFENDAEEGAGDDSKNDGSKVGGSSDLAALAEGRDVVGEMVRSWRRLFLSLLAIDQDLPNTQARRRGALAVLNGLLTVLLFHDNTHQVRVLLDTVRDLEKNAEGDDRKGVLGPCGHMVAEVAKFHYLNARMLLYDRKPALAIAALQQANRRLPPFPRCTDRGVRRNKLRVFFYLAIALLASGRRVPPAVLQADDLIQAVICALTAAVDSGSRHAFDAVVALYHPVLFMRGVYSIVVASIRPRCLLAALKRVHAAIARQGQDNSRIPMPALKALLDAADAAALRAIHNSGGEVGGQQSDRADAASSPWLPAPLPRLLPRTKAITERQAAEDTQVAADGVCGPKESLEVAVGGLIALGQVRGYVSTQGDGTIVLSKVNPFPKTDLPTTS